MASADLSGLRDGVWLERARGVQLTRFALLRGLGFIHCIAFAIIVRQAVPLLGEGGLLPIGRFLARVEAASPSHAAAFWRVPSLFWLDASDGFLLALGWMGLLLSLAVTLGADSALVQLLLWLIYGSFVHAGQIFYGYGWDILLLEAGFLSIFLAPLAGFAARPRQLPALPVIWLYRWLLFRLMLGAGLIKIRGDDCWRDLSCLVYHYETQPNPHLSSWLLHQAPPWFHSLGVLFNHFVELVVPFGLFGPRRLRHLAGALTAAFQFTLILSGNLSFLNWLTLVLALSCFDDAWLGDLLPERWRRRIANDALGPVSRARRMVTIALCAAVALLSLNPIANLASSRQRMNTGFDPLHLVNSYGAFGSIGRVRDEIVFEGAYADSRAGLQASELDWKEYEFPCKPGDPERAPCWVTPYHLRLDWQLWFAAMSRPEREPWLVHFAYKLLAGDEQVLGLLAKNPFPERPPDLLRASFYRYEFTRFGEPGYWRRTRLGTYLPPLAKSSTALRGYLENAGLW